VIMVTGFFSQFC